MQRAKMTFFCNFQHLLQERLTDGRGVVLFITWTESLIKEGDLSHGVKEILKKSLHLLFLRLEITTFSMNVLPLPLGLYDLVILVVI